MSEFATDELVADIQVRGNRTVPAARITGQMQTRVGRPFDPRALAADIKKLASLPYFVTVRPLHKSTEAGRVIVLEVVERRTLRYVEYLGNESVKEKKLAEATGLAVGGAVDPYAVEEGKRKIAALYQDNGFNRVHVEVVEGSKPEDQGVVYSINEGALEKIWAVEFVGNEFASEGQLKNKIDTKPGFAWLIGGKLKRDALDSDVQKLTDYYRSYGFFRADVGRTVELNDEGTWATVRFAINEGPRYAIRNVTLNGVTIFEESSVRAGLKLSDGKSFERLIQQADVAWLRDLYGSRGYIFADVRAEMLFLEEPGKIDLVYNVEEGKRWRVGQILVNIKGEDPHTRLPVALNPLGMAPGDWIDIRKIRDAERRLGASGIWNRSPAQGTVPNITYEPSEETKQQLANEEKAEEKDREGVFRGQSQAPSGPTPWTSYKPPLPSVYQVQQLQPVAADGWAPRTTHAVAKEPVAAEPGVFRGQSPSYGYPSAGQPANGSVYQVQQSNAGTAEEALARSGTIFADPGPPAGAIYNGSTAADAHYNAYTGGYGGTAVGATDPSVAPVNAYGAPVQPMGVVETPNSVAPAQYAQSYPATPGYPPQPAYPPAASYPPADQPPQNYQSAPIAPPTYGQPTSPVYGSVAADSYQSMNPVNTRIFPSQVYAPTPVPPPNDPFADLVLNLEETQTGRFMVGVAVNSDAGVVGQISLDEQNFDWRRFPRSMQDVYDGTAFRGGGQRFRLEAAPGTQVQRYLASWQEPYLLDTPISLNLSGSYYDRRYDDWDENRLGGRVGLGYQWTDRDLSGMLTYRGESIKFDSDNNILVPEYVEAEGKNSLHGFGVRLVNDKRDNPFLATEGYYVSGSVEQVVGSFTYTRAEIDARTYMLLKERPDHTGRHVLTFQTRLGITGSDTPVYDRWYAGGFSTMRGFDFRGASPLRNGYEVGGDWMFINTLEYMFPLTADDMIHGVAFVDHGTVTESVSLSDYRVAPGLGLRITVPAMGPAPIALDFAWPVAGPDFDDKRVFTFNVGFQR
ncbi:BamA/TamA family outer membrane protein [Botrimarina colliarenosi]|uniref:BamA/TamA family outer membrane protein n=1 Tax=Botrimarina colliarenosi TaxID=2528001 RepID=UPI0018D4CE80|nr:BamA/TamA family outer membrane protein [Botrimarina colliarenosi]